ncbi:MAG: methylenetetrahydrofolate reductase [NAD(P)H] [Polyangiaceae bacterium]|nr:methylenetetrahydrofolate reductase [NAD(P)H] [Polyangiaceae bacterium]
MKIIDHLGSSRPVFSFEFFPPRDEEGREQLYYTVARLRPYAPAYVSVTYGAGGSTRRLTVDLVKQIQRETGITAMAHLTCVGSTTEQIAGVLTDLASGGIENVLPLRGDPPKGEAEFRAPEGGFAHASELVAFIRERFGDRLCLAGAAYPEKHPEAPTLAADLAHLKAKVDAGVEFLVTQLFFDSREYFAFVARARAAGIAVPILPGIMPITNLSQIKRFTATCGATIPEALLARLEEVGDDAEQVRAIGVGYATRQCRQLIEGGAPGIHFFTLNRSPATVHILEAIQ